MLGRTTTPPPAAQSGQSVQPPAPASSPTRRFTDAAAGATRFGPALRIHGSIAGPDSVVIAGSVEGPIEIDGLLHIQESGRVTGPVTAADVVIEGELQGRLVVRGRVELRATARVRADIQAGTVAIAEGCFFDGRVHMGGGEGERGPTHFREKRRRRGHRPGGPEAAASQPAPGEQAAADQPAAAPAAPEAPARPDASADRPPVPRPTV